MYFDITALERVANPIEVGSADFAPMMSPSTVRAKEVEIDLSDVWTAFVACNSEIFRRGFSPHFFGVYVHWRFHGILFVFSKLCQSVYM